MFPNNNSNFDRDFAKRSADFDRNFNRAKTAFGIWWVFCGLLGLGAVAVLAFVAWHFIAKVW